jgi:hypothetical protein
MVSSGSFDHNEMSAVPIQQADSIVPAKVFPLQNDTGPSFDDRADKGIEEVVLSPAGYARMAPTYIQGI